jgi:hypothetical protein
MTNIRLQPVDRQDDPTLLRELLLQGSPIGEPERHQLLVTIEEVGHRALRDIDAPTRKLAVDLWDATMVGVTQSAHHSDDVKAELTLRQGESSFLFRSARLMVKRATRVHAAADDQPETHQPFERGNGPRAMVGDPRLLAAGSAAIFEGLEPDLGGGRWTGLVSCHERVSSEVICSPAYVDTQPRSR